MKNFNRPLTDGDLLAFQYEEEVIQMIQAELARAEIKHPSWPSDQIHAAAIVTEECGELMRAAVQYELEKGSIENIEEEAIQTAATCIRLLKDIRARRRRADGVTVDHTSPDITKSAHENNPALPKISHPILIDQVNDAVKFVDSNLVSDGYYTFGELYEHRIKLFIALCKMYNNWRAYTSGLNYAWRSMNHSDGTYIDGYFILGLFKEEGRQITYHLPMRYWSDCEFAEFSPTAPEWDKHTSKDVLERIELLYRGKP